MANIDFEMIPQFAENCKLLAQLIFDYLQIAHDITTWPKEFDSPLPISPTHLRQSLDFTLDKDMQNPMLVSITVKLIDLAETILPLFQALMPDPDEANAIYIVSSQYRELVKKLKQARSGLERQNVTSWNFDIIQGWKRTLQEVLPFYRMLILRETARLAEVLRVNGPDLHNKTMQLASRFYEGTKAVELLDHSMKLLTDAVRRESTFPPRRRFRDRLMPQYDGPSSIPPPSSPTALSDYGVMKHRGGGIPIASVESSRTPEEQEWVGPEPETPPIRNHNHHPRISGSSDGDCVFTGHNAKEGSRHDFENRIDIKLEYYDWAIKQVANENSNIRQQCEKLHVAVQTLMTISCQCLDHQTAAQSFAEQSSAESLMDQQHPSTFDAPDHGFVRYVLGRGDRQKLGTVTTGANLYRGSMVRPLEEVLGVPTFWARSPHDPARAYDPNGHGFN